MSKGFIGALSLGVGLTLGFSAGFVTANSLKNDERAKIQAAQNNKINTLSAIIHNIPNNIKSIYNSLTFWNVAEFTCTCIAVSFAANLAIPPIKNIFHLIFSN